MNECAPVLISVYHRLYTLKKCVEALKANEEARFTDLYVVSDGPARPEHEAKIVAVRDYVRHITGFRSVTLIARSENWGASKSIGTAYRDVCSRYGKIVFMEDDILPSRYYLSYLNWGLKKYEDDPRVFAICAYKSKFPLPRGFKNDVFFMKRFSPWGYATWQSRSDKRFNGSGVFVDRRCAYDRFTEFQKTMPELFLDMQQRDPMMLHVLKSDSDGVIVAGDVRVEYYLQRSGMLCLYPSRTMSQVMQTGDDAMHATMRWCADEKFRDDRMDFNVGLTEVDERIYSAFLAAKKIPLWRRALYAFSHERFGTAVGYYWHRIFGGSRKMGYKE